MKKRAFLGLRSYILFATLLVLSFGAGIVAGNIRNQTVGGNLFGRETVTDENFYRYYTMFREAYAVLQNEFVNAEKVDSKTLLSGAIKGMLQSTGDPYTDYLAPDIAKEFAANIQGSFEGVGIRMEQRDGILTVISSLPGTPASLANIQPNDRIVEIDGKTTKDMTSMEAVSLIRGKIGTSVNLTLARPGVIQPFTVSLKRDRINIDTIEKGIIESDGKRIGYIKLIEFGEPTYSEFQKALSSLSAQNIDSIILDVRNNPGGLLTSVAQISDLLLEKGLIVYTVGRMGNENYEFRATGRNLSLKPNVPMAILINQGSASASEILAGALQDTHRAVVVGKKSFGKGSVQKTRDLPDSSILKYTVAKYYTPAGRTIDGTGLVPDLEINMWYDDLSENQKAAVVQLQVTNLVSDFLQRSPVPSATELTNFHKTVVSSGINLPYEITSNVVLQRIDSLSTNIFNLRNDPQLQSAVRVVTSDYNKYKKDLTYYDKRVEVEAK
ncbi:MAG: S41 family peptidase [Brevinema sp.]